MFPHLFIFERCEEDNDSISRLWQHISAAIFPLLYIFMQMILYDASKEIHDLGRRGVGRFLTWGAPP